MNERIRKLELKAIDYANSKVPASDRYNDIYYSIVCGYFAKLIVEECIGVIEVKMPEFTCKEEYDNLIRKAGRMDAIDEIKQHFGVDE